MTKKHLTLRKVQRRQWDLKSHTGQSFNEAQITAYDEPFIKIGELIPALWRHETTGRLWRTPDPKVKKKQLKDVNEKVQVLLGACVLHLVDYCNAKRIDFANLVESTLSGVERARANMEKRP